MNGLMKKTVLASLIATLAVTPILAEAHGRGGGHGGGGGWWFPALLGGALIYDITRPHYYQPDPYPYYQPAPVYYQPAPVYVQPPQQVYVQPAPTYQQQQPSYAPPTAAAQTWYYCSSAKGYYPYVRVCPGGWEQVPAMPPAAMQ